VNLFLHTIEFESVARCQCIMVLMIQLLVCFRTSDRAYGFSVIFALKAIIQRLVYVELACTCVNIL